MEKEIKLYSSASDFDELKKTAEKLIDHDRKFHMYRMACALISLLFLAFSVYSVVVLIQSGSDFQIGMLIYIIVPLIGSVLPFSFVKMKRKEMIDSICEEQGTVVNFREDRITVSGSKKLRLVRKSNGTSCFEKSGSLFSDGDGALIPFSYDIRLSELRYYAYEIELSRFRFIVGSAVYPDLIIMKNEALEQLCDELEKRGIKKTAFVK